MNSPPLLSLVTGTLGRPEAYRRLVDSIRRHTQSSWELVVADASDPSYVEQGENIVILPERPRLNHSKGYNRAFRACVGEFILWLNDDAEVCEGYDTEAIQFMSGHPKIGLGALHYSQNGGPFHANSAYGCVYANFGIFRKSVGEQVGYFDEEISMYGADNSLAIRMLMADYGVADIPKARILHHSVDDPIRRENQAGRRHDNKVLTVKYMPYRKQWQSTYEKHIILSGIEPWSHGVQPVLTNA